MTHDIDSPWKYGLDLLTLFKKILLPIKQNLDFKKSCSFLCNAIRCYLTLIPDPYYTFEWILKIAQQHNFNTFYIISGASSKYDPGYSLFTKRFSLYLVPFLLTGIKLVFILVLCLLSTSSLCGRQVHSISLFNLI